MAGSCCPSATATETRRCPTTRARPFRGRMDDCSYSLSRMRRSGTARCPRPLPGPRTCYRTRRAQKNATRTGARARQHDEPPYTHGARAKRGPRASHTHYEHTTSATRRPAREKRTTHTSNLNATARLQIAPSPDRGAGDGTAFNLTATARPRDGGTVAAVYTWNSQSMDGPGVRPKGGPLHKGPPSRVRVAMQRLVLETQSRPETIHAQVQRGVLPPRILGFWEAISHT